MFKSINAYDKEEGFLYSKNFSSDERNIIHKNIAGEKVFILSFEDYFKYYNNMDLSLLFMPTKVALNKSEYYNKKLKSGLSFGIWTQDAIKDSPHAVEVFEAPDTKGTGIANVGYKGIAPAIYLNLKKLNTIEIQGQGTIINPYEIKVRDSTPTLLNLFIIATLIFFIFFILRRKKALLMILILLLFSFTSCQSHQDSRKIEEYEKPKVVILSYARRIDRIMERLEELFNDDNKIMIINENGENKTSWAKDYYERPETEKELKEIFEDLTLNNFRVVKGGDFRVTTMKKEIDSVFEGIGLIVTNKNLEEDPQLKFLNDMKSIYYAKDYNSIIDYLEDNGFLIKHPYDLYTHGISLLNTDIDF